MNPASRRPWRALLDGSIARSARDVLEEIAGALSGDADGAALYDGAAGRAVFYRALADAWPEREFAAMAERHLGLAIDRLATEDMPECLFTGFAGVAWAAEHVKGRFERPGDDDANEELDATLLDLLGESPWRGDFDLTFGLAGLGVYALERIRRPLGRAMLARVVRRLEERAEPRRQGLAWHTGPRPDRPDLSPAGEDCLGVAHGAPGVVVVLAGAVAAGVEEERARRLLDGGLRWMLAQRRSDGPTAFSRGVTEGSAAWAPARSAWCYGDPGVAAALGAAARALGDDDLAGEMRALGQRAIARPMTECSVVDAGVCHGAAGLVHIYNRLWQSTGDDSFADASRRWLARTLELRIPGQGVAGFRSCCVSEEGDGEVFWKDDSSLLYGACGVGLVLLAALAPIEPAWDRMLGLSLPA